MRLRSFLCFALLFSLACATAPADRTSPAADMAASASNYSPQSSKFAVGAIPEVTLRDAQRGRDVQMDIDYPMGIGGPYPVIVFSHGFGAQKHSYVAFAEYWTSQGYIVVRPWHADAGKLRDLIDDLRERTRIERERQRAGEKPERQPRPERRRAGQEPPLPPSLPELLWEAETPAMWRDRARDVSFAIDSLPALEERYPELKGKIDRNKIAVAGHSYGAFTAMLLAGARATREGTAVAVADPRVRAVIALSPQGTGELQGLTRESWAEVRVPILYMTGSRDLAVDVPETWRREPFDYGPAGDKYFVSFEGARHASFTGRIGEADIDAYRTAQASAQMPPPDDRDIYGRRRYDAPVIAPMGGGDPGFWDRERRVINAIKIATSAFLDAYLKEDAKAREFLGGAGLQSLNGGSAVVERK